MVETIVKSLNKSDLATILIYLGLIREVRLLLKLLLNYKLEVAKLKK